MATCTCSPGNPPRESGPNHARGCALWLPWKPMAPEDGPDLERSPTATSSQRRSWPQSVEVEVCAPRQTHELSLPCVKSPGKCLACQLRDTQADIGILGGLGRVLRSHIPKDELRQTWESFCKTAKIEP